MEKDKICLEISDWETPTTKYPLTKVNDVSITRFNQKSGVYRMEGVRGYVYYHHIKRVPVTCLNIRKETVMVDDPLHWYGMQELAKNCKGKVLIAGLGLGLILHALQTNKEVTQIDEILNTRRFSY